MELFYIIKRFWCVRDELISIGYFSVTTYREYPAYMVTYGDGEFEIFAEHIEGFDLI